MLDTWPAASRGKEGGKTKAITPQVQPPPHPVLPREKCQDSPWLLSKHLACVGLHRRGVGLSNKHISPSPVSFLIIFFRMEAEEEHRLQDNSSKACTFMSANPFLQSSQTSSFHILPITIKCLALPLPLFISYGAKMNFYNYSYTSVFSQGKQKTRMAVHQQCVKKLYTAKYIRQLRSSVGREISFMLVNTVILVICT